MSRRSCHDDRADDSDRSDTMSKESTVTQSYLRKELLEQALRHAGNIISESISNHAEILPKEARQELKTLAQSLSDADSAIRRAKV